MSVGFFHIKPIFRTSKMAIITACWCIDFVILLIVGFLALYRFYKKKFEFWDKYNVPHTKPKFPFGDIGIPTLSENIVETLDRIYKRHQRDRLVGLWFSFQPILVVKDPDILKDILVKDFMHFHSRGFPYDEENDPLSAHLFSLEGSKWKNLRAKLSPTFTSGKMKMMFPILLQCSKELISILDRKAMNREIVEMKDILSRFTTDIIASCAFGIETNSLKNPNTKFLTVGKAITETSLTNALRRMVAMVPAVAKFFKITMLPKDATDFFLNAVRDTIDYREKNNVKRNDFMQLLIQLKNKGKLDDIDEMKGSENVEDNKAVQTFTFEEAAAQAFIFFFAGYETSSTTMQFVLYELALQPEIQEKLRDEIKTELAKHGGELTYEAVFGMDYLGCVIDETLRKYPVAGLLFRSCNKEYKISDSNMIIPKGVMVQIPIYSLHMDSNYFPNPERFDPDRFTEEAKSQRHRYAYLPFGEGPRNCIGMRFGQMQTRVGIIQLLLNYKFEVCEKTPIPIKFSNASLTPKEGMHLRISKVN